jgi:hypothetical protein
MANVKSAATKFKPGSEPANGILVGQHRQMKI